MQQPDHEHFALLLLLQTEITIMRNSGLCEYMIAKSFRLIDGRAVVAISRATVRALCFVIAQRASRVLELDRWWRAVATHSAQHAGKRTQSVIDI